MTGVYGWTDCSVDSNDNSGCITNSTSTASYGAGFAAAGGGVYVAEYTDTAITVWFLTVSPTPRLVSSRLGDGWLIDREATCRAT